MKVLINIPFIVWWVLLCGSELWIKSCIAISPKKLWTILNSTIAGERLSGERLLSQDCVNVLLYNEDLKAAYIQKNYTGSNYLFVNVDGNKPDGFMSDEKVSEVRELINSSRRFRRCIFVISLVNTSKDIRLLMSEKEELIQTIKLDYSIQLTKLLQFKTPVNRRVLLLVRFGHSDKDFGKLPKPNHVYLKYPRRLVPIWEQALFDFFPCATAVNVKLQNEDCVTTRTEFGNLIWMCDDIIAKLEKEEECKKKSDLSDPCHNKIVKGEYSLLSFNIHNCSSFKARI